MYSRNEHGATKKGEKKKVIPYAALRHFVLPFYIFVVVVVAVGVAYSPRKNKEHNSQGKKRST